MKRRERVQGGRNNRKKGGRDDEEKVLEKVEVRRMKRKRSGRGGLSDRGGREDEMLEERE